MPQFNLDQVLKQTPKIVKQIRDGLLFIVAGSLVSASFIAPKLGMSGEDYATVAGIAILLIRGVSMMFGVTDEQALQDARNTIKRIEGKDQ